METEITTTIIIPTIIITTLILIELKYTNHVMHSTVPLQSMNDHSEFLRSSSQTSFPLIYILNVTPYGMEYSFGQLRSIVLAVSSKLLLSISLLDDGVV